MPPCFYSLCYADITCDNETNSNLRLLEAAEKGIPGFVKKILECEYTNINTRDSDGRTSLYLATQENHTDVIGILLGIENIDVNMGTEDDGETPLILAAKYGRPRIVKLLLENSNVDVNQGLTSTGLNALVASLRLGYDEIASLLLNHPKIEINRGLKNRKTPLMVAASNPNLKHSTMELLLSQPGIDVNRAVFDGQTALFFAVKSKHIMAVEMLLRCPKVATNLENDLYKRAEDYAEDYYTTSLFQSRGYHMRAKGHSCCSDKIGRGILLAIERGQTKWFQTFIRCPQIKINIGDQNGVTPLIEATRNGNSKIVELLLSSPEIDTNKYNSVNGKTALMVAVEEWGKKGKRKKEGSKGDVIKMLLSNPQIDVDISDIKGESALQKAILRGDLRSANLILRCPKTKTDRVVAKNDDIREAIRMRDSLLSVGHTCCLRINEGLVHATDHGYFREVRGLLQCPGADSNLLDRRGRALLYLASWKNHNGAVKVLLDHETINVNMAAPLDGSTAFSIASEKGHLKVLKSIISFVDKGHNINYSKGWCKDNWTRGTVLCKETDQIEWPKQPITVASTYQAGEYN